MAKLKIARNVLQSATERSVLSDDEKAQLLTELGIGGSGSGSVSTDLTKLPMPFIWSLLDDSRLSPNQRASIALRAHGMGRSDIDHKSVYTTTCHNPVDFGSTFLMLGSKSPNCEVFYNGRWYPIVLHVDFHKDDSNRTRNVMLSAYLSICEITYPLTFAVYREMFMDDDGEPCERTVEDVLHRFGLRGLTKTPADFNLKLVRAERAARENGSMVLISGPVLEFSEQAWWARLQSRALGSPESPRKAVVEPELEVSEDYRSYHSHYGRNEQVVSRLPFVRVFSLDTKRYVFADVDDVSTYEFSEDAMTKLHLPDEMLSILTRVFNTPIEHLFGDLIEGKHGGVVILASGNPGVGKTLTAEVYAEQTQRPLYVLELGELGTNVEQVEQNLSRVFTRVARWNAVLQFDECEIFLSERGGDLDRSAIVGIFLRLLDYYEGILFLTTNRADVLDHAVRSRVMLRLQYPDLDQSARAQIWETMFDAAGLQLEQGSFVQLADEEINGRQIRNLTRLAKVLQPEGKISLEQMRGVLEYGCR